MTAPQRRATVRRGWCVGLRVRVVLVFMCNYAALLNTKCRLALKYKYKYKYKIYL
jgi:hypothetical protein